MGCPHKFMHGGGVSKKCASKRGGSGEFEHGFSPFAPALSLLNDDPSLNINCEPITEAKQYNSAKFYIFDAL